MADYGNMLYKRPMACETTAICSTELTMAWQAVLHTLGVHCGGHAARGDVPHHHCAVAEGVPRRLTLRERLREHQGK
jgi:hypothetical protein